MTTFIWSWMAISTLGFTGSSKYLNFLFWHKYFKKWILYCIFSSCKNNMLYVKCPNFLSSGGLWQEGELVGAYSPVFLLCGVFLVSSFVLVYVPGKGYSNLFIYILTYTGHISNILSLLDEFSLLEEIHCPAEQSRVSKSHGLRVVWSCKTCLTLRKIFRFVCANRTFMNFNVFYSIFLYVSHLLWDFKCYFFTFSCAKFQK